MNYMCGPCIEEMPDLEKVSKAYERKGVEFIGLTLDSDEEEVKAISDQLGISYALTKEHISSKFDYVPVTLFVDSNGRVLDTFIPGGTTESDLNKVIDNLIK